MLCVWVIGVRDAVCVVIGVCDAVCVGYWSVDAVCGLWSV